MSFDPLDPLSLRFGRVVHASRYAFASEPERIHRAAQQNLREGLADFICAERCKIIKQDNHVEFRLDLYVATPEEFWAAVRHQAFEMARRMNVDSSMEQIQRDYLNKTQGLKEEE